MFECCQLELHCGEGTIGAARCSRRPMQHLVHHHSLLFSFLLFGNSDISSTTASPSAGCRRVREGAFRRQSGAAGRPRTAWGRAPNYTQLRTTCMYVPTNKTPASVPTMSTTVLSANDHAVGSTVPRPGRPAAAGAAGPPSNSCCNRPGRIGRASMSSLPRAPMPPSRHLSLPGTLDRPNSNSALPLVTAAGDGVLCFY